MDGKSYPIKAQVHSLAGYSAHADQRNLLSFVQRIQRGPKEVNAYWQGSYAPRKFLCGERIGVYWNRVPRSHCVAQEIAEGSCRNGRRLR